jgi:hypothetical protein
MATKKASFIGFFQHLDAVLHRVEVELRRLTFILSRIALIGSIIVILCDEFLRAVL